MKVSLLLTAVSMGFTMTALLSTANAQGKDPPGVNPAHYQCYRVAPQGTFKPITVTLKDQFDTEKLTVGGPTMLCVPSLKTVIKQ